MSTGENGVCVRILEKEFRIGCPAHQEEALRESARYLDLQMRKIRQSGKVIGMERIAMMAALNIANEFLTLKNTPSDLELQFADRIKELQTKLDAALVKPVKTVKTTEPTA